MLPILITSLFLLVLGAVPFLAAQDLPDTTAETAHLSLEMAFPAYVTGGHADGSKTTGSYIEPAIKPEKPSSGPTMGAERGREGVNWRGVFGQSAFFLGIEHAFRCATEEGTRDGFSYPFGKMTLNSITNLHGWADGDEFFVNYVGHPMEGAVAGFLWTQNDTRYLTAEFGQNRRYWKSRLRAAAFSWAYSEIFEIGPASEASMGHIQAFFPQQGFVDHVVTPFVGTGWMVAEDAVDQYLVRFIESRTDNRYFRLVARGGLNPARTMANALRFKAPWHRDNRPGVLSYAASDPFARASLRRSNTAIEEVSPPPGVAPFEFTMAPVFRNYVGKDSSGSCIGGGGGASFRLAPEWQFLVDVSGCKMMGLERNLSGDSLSYLAGPRWHPSPGGRWSPYAQLLVGGNKLTQERMYPEKKRALQAIAEAKGTLAPVHEDYTAQYETNGLSLQAGVGVDFKLNSALAVRVASLEYTHSWVNTMNRINYSNGLQFTSGLVLRMGTW